jgi:hypothetical protein
MIEDRRTKIHTLTEENHLHDSALAPIQNEALILGVTPHHLNEAAIGLQFRERGGRGESFGLEDAEAQAEQLRHEWRGVSAGAGEQRVS